ncbi:MAG: AraC family transcriptional regulator, partial [Chloroflexi bacterium]
RPMNLDFEGIDPDNLPNSWFITGKIWQDYEMHRDENVFATGEASALLAATEAPLFSSGAIMQVFDSQLYLGNRVRLSALIKTEDVTDWAGLSMSAGRSENEIYQFDNMQNRPITGTTDWTRYEIVLDVPTASEMLSIGVHLAGNGRVWIDNVAFEIVDDNTPSTHCQECLE